jgi:tRNA threonylcarbamoyladenosine modification (KEOPS) complex  Pcc1 subunit
LNDGEKASEECEGSIVRFLGQWRVRLIKTMRVNDSEEMRSQLESYLVVVDLCLEIRDLQQEL